MKPRTNIEAELIRVRMDSIGKICLWRLSKQIEAYGKPFEHISTVTVNFKTAGETGRKGVSVYASTANGKLARHLFTYTVEDHEYVISSSLGSLRLSGVKR